MSVVPPRVTAVVPVYGGGRRAIEAIESLLEQTYPSMEILVINDGSPLAEDHDLADRFEHRIRYVHHDNLGLCATLNRALFDLVDTPLFARLDHDDVAAPERIAEQVALLDAEGADACLTRIWRTGPSGRRLSLHPDEAGESFAYDPRRHGQIVHSTLLAGTDFLRQLGGYDASLYPADDYDLSLRMHAAGRVIVHGAPLVDYRIHEASQTFVHFEDMSQKGRYLEEREAAGPDGFPSYPTWVAANPLTPRARRRLQGRAWYRRAGVTIDDGRWLHGGALLAGALILDPRFTYRRLRTVKPQRST